MGRPKQPKILKGKVIKNTCKKVRNPVSICLVLEKEHLEFIRNQALKKSVMEGVLVGANDMIRDALAVAFPAPKQFDLFGDKK